MRSMSEERDPRDKWQADKDRETLSTILDDLDNAEALKNSTRCEELRQALRNLRTFGSDLEIMAIMTILVIRLGES